MEDNKHILWFALLVLVSLASYGLYSETRRELSEAQEQIAQLLQESETTIVSQQETIEAQGEELAQVRANEELLQQAVASFERNEPSSVTLSSSSIINQFAPAVVRVVCVSRANSRALQQGSGVLFVSDSNQHYIQTNLHVVRTADGSPSQCAVALYGDQNNPNEYILFATEGYSLFRQGIDLAYIEPREIQGNTRSGKLSDLSRYALRDNITNICSSVSIGDGVSVLGYPGIGGDTLTVTDGIISGFEFRSGTRYIKTSAKIDQGNSGGIAIKDTGCIVGIPTFVQSQIESLGRILDLNRLVN